MLIQIESGDVVKSTAGRDKEKIFLVVDVLDNFVYLVDGKTHKTSSPKKKSIKHVKNILPKGLKSLSDRIKRGELVGNKRISRSLPNKKI